MNESNNVSLAAARYTRVKLWPRGSFHFGKRGVGLNETEIAMPADSYFSAICHAIHELEGPDAVAALIAQFPRSGEPECSPPFRITSLMPFAAPLEAGDAIHLLPMPLLHIAIGGDPITQRKAMKQIDWVSHAIFAQLISGQSMVDQVGDVDRDYFVADPTDKQKATPRTVQNGVVWLAKDEYNHLDGRNTRLWAIDTRPRVTVDRMSGASAVYSSGSVRFSANAGLYFYIEWRPEADVQLRQRISAAIAYLGDSGIGGERSYGYGQYKAEFEHLSDMPIAEPVNATHITTLAPFLPNVSERSTLAAPGSRYEIILRRGWLTLPGYSNLRRPTVRMVNTGAILTTADGVQPTGYLADATPAPLQGSNYAIHRYGLCWPVAVIPQSMRQKGNN